MHFHVVKNDRKKIHMSLIFSCNFNVQLKQTMRFIERSRVSVFAAQELIKSFNFFFHLLQVLLFFAYSSFILCFSFLNRYFTLCKCSLRMLSRVMCIFCFVLFYGILKINFKYLFYLIIFYFWRDVFNDWCCVQLND